MRCPRCGNEASQEEPFCGQCGAPTEQQIYRTNNVSFTPHQPMQPPSDPNQQTRFYQDATEAISIYPKQAGPAYPTAYQRDPNATMQAGYPAVTYPQAPMAPLPQGNFAALPPSPVPPPPAYNNGYYMQSQALPLQQRSHNTTIIVICICLVVVLLGAIGITTLLMTRNQQAIQVHQTAIATPAATAIATPSPTPLPTPSPTALPTPTTAPVTPTPVADAGFSWCGATCTPYNFSVEYPNGWTAGAATNGAGVQFTNPAQLDQFISIKALGPTASPASTLVSSDLQTNFASKVGYTPPTGYSSGTISGETWIAALAYYQSDAQQKERIIVYATVHQGKGYIIELNAADAQFDAVNAQFFNVVLSKFRFLQPTL